MAASQHQPLSSTDSDCDVTDDAVLFWGRSGEAAMDMKADGAQMVAVMAAFLTAFSMDKMLSLTTTDFEDEQYFTYYALSLAMSCSCGFYCLLILTFISVKLKRLTNRSASQVGQVGGASATELRDIHGGDFKAKVLAGWIGENTAFGRHPAFHARYWYNTGLVQGQVPGIVVTPRTLFSTSLVAFMLMCCAFMAAMSIKVMSATAFELGITTMLILITPLVAAFILLATNSAIFDLA